MGCDYYIHTYIGIYFKDCDDKQIEISTQRGYYGTYDDDNMTFEEYEQDIKRRNTTHQYIYTTGTWTIKNTQKYLDYLKELNIKLEEVQTITKYTVVTDR